MYYEKFCIYGETWNIDLSDKPTLSCNRIFETIVQQEHDREHQALFTTTLNSAH
jgi:hypothetical protein